MYIGINRYTQACVLWTSSNASVSAAHFTRTFILYFVFIYPLTNVSAGCGGDGVRMCVYIKHALY